MLSSECPRKEFFAGTGPDTQLRAKLMAWKETSLDNP